MRAVLCALLLCAFAWAQDHEERIRKLEEQLGVQVFERSKRYVRVTDIGADIVRRAREILRQIAELERVAADNPDGLLTPAEFRDISGIGRNLAIEVLEFFDKARFTRRSAAGRTILKPATEVFGGESG